jgi:PAS domain S-box-containing protein
MYHLTRNSLRIVHLDDCDDFTHVTAVFLRLRGFTEPVVRFNCGKKAVDYLSKVEPGRAPHVILLDLSMPGLSGWDVLRWLREDYRNRAVPVYILTSSEEPGVRLAALEAGATAYHCKSDLFHDLICDLEQEMALYNHKHMDEMKLMGEIMAELALQGGASADMVVLADPGGGVEWVNDAFVHACGYTLEEVRGKKPGDLLRGPESEPASIELLHHAVHAACECECRITHHRKNGTTYPAHISLCPVFGEGVLRGFLAVGQDLSACASWPGSMATVDFAGTSEHREAQPKVVPSL